MVILSKSRVFCVWTIFSPPSGFFRTFPDLAGFFRTFPDLAGFSRILPDLAGCFRTFPATVRQFPAASRPPRPATARKIPAAPRFHRAPSRSLGMAPAQLVWLEPCCLHGAPGLTTPKVRPTRVARATATSHRWCDAGLKRFVLLGFTWLPFCRFGGHPFGACAVIFFSFRG